MVVALLQPYHKPHDMLIWLTYMSKLHYIVSLLQKEKLKNVRQILYHI